MPFCSGIEAAFQLVVPDAVPATPVVRFYQATAVTPTLSDAVPLIVTGLVPDV